MKLELHLAQDFGAHLADGMAAAEYRMGRIEPYVGFSEQIVLDFTGVRNANSSFMNALIAGIIEQHGEEILRQFVFKGCNPIVRVLVESAIDLGVQKIDGRIDA